MAPREIRATNLAYGMSLAGSAGLLLLALGAHRVGDIKLWCLQWLGVAGGSLLLLSFAGSDEARGTPGLSGVAWGAMATSWVFSFTDWPEWPSYAVLAFVPYMALSSFHALRWFFGGRQTAWSRAQP